MNKFIYEIYTRPNKQIQEAQNRGNLESRGSSVDALIKLGKQKEATLLGVIPLKIHVEPSINTYEVAVSRKHVDDFNMKVNYQRNPTQR